jgi:cellulose biosynthesis protein BcsQ
MMRTIFFAGIKGGAGKTTLSLQLCRYLHFYEELAVQLVSLDECKTMTALKGIFDYPFPIMEITREQWKQNNLSNNVKYRVVDLPTDAGFSQISLMKPHDLVVIPFQYHIYDFYRVIYFIKLAKEKISEKNIFLLPNRYNSRFHENNLAYKLFEENKITRNLIRLPPIAQSTKLSEYTFHPPSPEILNFIRPSFIKLLEKLG